MNEMVLKSNHLATRLGFWSALLAAATFLIFTVCFIAVFLNPPLFIWTNFADYVASARNNQQFFKSIAQLAMLLFAPLYVMLVNSLHELAPSEKKVATRLSLSFGLLFAVLVGGFYFVQLSAVRLSVAKDQFAGLEQIVQANPYSALSALNMLGWTLFFGLSSLFVAPVFSGSKLAKAIRWLFVINGMMCLLGGLGYALEITTLVFFTINFGMGGAVTLFTIALCVYFRRMERQVTP
ncbi:MAG TPA: hypothetical protein VLG46_02800 [Anaerolineae bacterium]|nr:hypothetical protein [Anaerolineae bacterium]